MVINLDGYSSNTLNVLTDNRKFFLGGNFINFQILIIANLVKGLHDPTCRALYVTHPRSVSCRASVKLHRQWKAGHYAVWQIVFRSTQRALFYSSSHFMHNNSLRWNAYSRNDTTHELLLNILWQLHIKFLITF